MYKITNEMFGIVKIEGHNLSYKGFVIIKKLTEEINNLAEKKIIKVKPYKIKKVMIKNNSKKNKEG